MKCTPLKKVFDGRLYFFADHVLSKIEEWREAKEMKNSKKEE